MVNTFKRIIDSYAVKIASIVFGSLITSLIWFVRIEIDKIFTSVNEVKETLSFLVNENLLVKQRLQMTTEALEAKQAIQLTQIKKDIDIIRDSIRDHDQNTRRPTIRSE